MVNLTKERTIIKWKNKLSGEEGYVKDVNKTEKHFINTFEHSDARVFSTVSAAKSVIRSLVDYGEGDMNDFEVVSVQS